MSNRIAVCENSGELFNIFAIKRQFKFGNAGSTCNKTADDFNIKLFRKCKGDKSFVKLHLGENFEGQLLGNFHWNQNINPVVTAHSLNAVVIWPKPLPLHKGLKTPTFASKFMLMLNLLKSAVKTEQGFWPSVQVDMYFAFILILISFIICKVWQREKMQQLLKQNDWISFLDEKLVFSNVKKVLFKPMIYFYFLYSNSHLLRYS